ncbi:hypothetical protein DAI22_11g135200 [Oryza sativa Japonica Group]|nr:hypothetical protein DAI22_11g135200 [Oryza sativa Japonica Group]
MSTVSSSRWAPRRSGTLFFFMLMGLNHDCNGRPSKSEAGLPINLNGQAFQAWWPGGCSASATVGNISAENCFLGLKKCSDFDVRFQLV